MSNRIEAVVAERIDFRQTQFLTSAAHHDGYPADTGAEVVFVGRSNAGKSSAINAICNRTGLAKVAKKPGRTRMINFFALSPNHRLVDLPGYGYAQAAKTIQREWQALMTDYFSKRCCLKAAIMIVDIRRLLTDLDWQMIDWCGNLPLHIVLSKADKLNKNELNRSLTNVNDALRNQVSVQTFSAKTRKGVTQARQAIIQCLDL